MAVQYNVFSNPNRETKIQYQVIDYLDGFKVLGELDNVKDCSITEDTSAAMKVTGTLNYEGTLQLNPLKHLIRVNSISKAGGVETTICHGTFFVSASSYDLKEDGSGGSLKLFSTLQAAKDIVGLGTYTQKVGTTPWSAIQWLANMAHVKLLSEPITYQFKEEKTYEGGKNWLEIANDLLSICNYSDLDVTPYGDFITKKYVDPSKRGETAVLKDSGTNPIISGRVISKDVDLSAIPNSSTVLLSPSGKDAQPTSVTVRNNDSKSPFSITNRGREIRIFEKYSELAIPVRDKAIENLRNAMQVTEGYQLQMLWNEIYLGDVVRIDYERLGLMNVRAEVTKRTTKMSAGLISTIELKRVLDNFDIEVS